MNDPNRLINAARERACRYHDRMVDVAHDGARHRTAQMALAKAATDPAVRAAWVKAARATNRALVRARRYVSTL